LSFSSSQKDFTWTDINSELKKPNIQRTAAAMLTRIKDKISRVAQRALGIDDKRFRVDLNQI